VLLVVADTGPINYLVLIGHIELLPRLFGKVALPKEVYGELTSERTPEPIRQWIADPPAWLDILDVPSHKPSDSSLINIDLGERAAILLALSLHADLLLMDDRKGVRAAERNGLRVTGTIGVLDVAAEHKLVDFAQAIQKLERTNFRLPANLLNVLLTKHKGR
jgi:predicted nucleic acid-binding protein